jgi:hypothetical protein
MQIDSNLIFYIEIGTNSRSETITSYKKTLKNYTLQAKSKFIEHF